MKTERKDKTEFSIIASDKLTEKFDKLNLSGSLQISILGGNIELSEGSANYLKKKRTNTRQSSIHIKFQYKTAIKELTMDQLHDSNLNYPHLQKSGRIGSATHVVTQIQYGAEATFTFTKTLSETEDEQEVNGQLKLGAEQFLKCLQGNVKSGGELEDIFKGKENNIECHFRGDFQLHPNIQTPTTYEEAIEFAKKFIQLATESVAKDTDGNQPLGIPISVSLYPLVLMKDALNAPALRYEITQSLASECVRIMQNYEDVEDKVYYMLEDPLVKKLSPFQKKLKRFQQYLTTFLAELKLKLGEMVVDIRSGKAKVDSFEQLLNRLNDQHFPFNVNHLDGWMKQKHKELCMIKRFQDEAQNKITNRDKVNFFPSTEKLQEQMTKFPVEFGFELTITSLAREEKFFEQLNQPLKFTSEISATDSNDELWFENSTLTNQIQKEIVVFAELSDNYSNDKKFAFAITAHEECKEISASQFSIIIHNKQKRIFGWEAILMCCKYFHETKLIEFIRLIVEDEISEDWNQIPLLALCRFYNKENLIDIVRLLIDKNIDVNCKSNNGWNALHAVCRYYDKENLIDIVRLLIDKNIDVNCKTNGGNNALTFLCQNYDKENLIDIVRLLIDKNIDVNCKENGGWNALHLVCYYSSKSRLVDLVRLLVQHKIDKKVTTTGGEIGTARSFLLKRFKEEEIKDILQILDSA